MIFVHFGRNNKVREMIEAMKVWTPNKDERCRSTEKRKIDGVLLLIFVDALSANARLN